MHAGEIYEARSSLNAAGEVNDPHIHGQKFKLTGQEPSDVERGVTVWASVNLATGEKHYFHDSHFGTLVFPVDEAMWTVAARMPIETEAATGVMHVTSGATAASVSVKKPDGAP